MEHEYYFAVLLRGEGGSREGAWIDAVNSFASDPGVPPESEGFPEYNKRSYLIVGIHGLYKMCRAHNISYNDMIKTTQEQGGEYLLPTGAKVVEVRGEAEKFMIKGYHYSGNDLDPYREYTWKL